MSQIEELRQIIVGSDSEKLAELKERIESIESRTKDVLEVLPPAIDAGIKQDDRLITALQNPVSESLKRAVRAEPEEYAEILYPVMGPSIRRAISQAISSLMITINQSIESATSANGLRLRMQSMRTGIPYAELALRRSLKYRVEHIYLIDRSTGMLISEMAGEGTSGLDSDAVSAMFSAIQSFVQDSFSKNEEDRLTDLKVGDHKVWITHGPNAMLACVIYGDAPESLKYQLTDKLDGIRSEYANELNDFDGDSSSFVGIEEKLKPLLQLQLSDEDDFSSTSSKPSLAKRLITFFLIIGFGYFCYNWFVEKSKLNTLERYLSDVPGLFVTKIYSQDDKIVVEGLKDIDANIPYSLLETNNISRDILLFKTKLFRSLDPDIVISRLQNELLTPDGVQIELRNDQLFLLGRADVEWLLRNDARITQLVNQGGVDASLLYASFSSLKGYFNSEINDFNVAEDLLTISNTPWIDVAKEAFGQ